MAFSVLRWRLNTLLCVLLVTIQSCSALTIAYCSDQNTGGSVALTDIYMSNGECHDKCDSSYAFAIVQDSNCWCSNYIPSDQVSTSQCNVDCPGYPDDKCGNAALGLYGYIALGNTPLGTAGGSSSSSSASQTSTSSAGRTSSSSSSPPSSEDSTSAAATTPAENVFLSTSSSPSSSTQQSSQSSKTTAATTPITSVQVVTLSGSMVTQTVTSTPTTGSTALLGGTQKKSSSMSGGLIAAAVVASIFGVVIIAALVFFFLRRRKRNNEEEQFGGLNDGSSPSNINRNASTNSKAGLLDRGYAPTITTRVSSHNGPDMSSTSDVMGPVTPNSERRHSRPLMYDQRLNPNALMVIDNGSHTSLNTLDDHRDYGRMLKVVNPDSTPRPSMS